MGDNLTHDPLLTKDYTTLLESGTLADVRLQVPGKEFRVHKAILAARSKVFAAMFSHKETSEAQQGVIDIPDIAVEVFERLLLYIYVGKVPPMDELTAELFIAADKVSVELFK